MGNFTNQLPEKIKSHLAQITKTSGLPDSEESVEKIAENWLEKEKMFDSQIETLDMIFVDTLNKEDMRGAVMLTFSGSILSVGTLTNDTRWMEYASIKLRSDVPSLVIDEGIKTINNIEKDNCIEFEGSRIKKTSNIFKIAVCEKSVSAEEQEKRIREATIFLTNGFIKLNRSIVYGEKLVDHFTMKTIIDYISKKNGITKKLTKQILNDYIYMLESGMLLGEKVPIGRLGKLTAKLKPAQKARVGRNPATGGEITITAKPKMFVPKALFGKIIKEKCGKMPVQEDE